MVTEELTLRKLAYVLLTCGMVWCVLIACERPAHAYIDPGSGLFLLQGIGTAFFGLLFVIKRKLKRLTGSKEPIGADAGDAKVSSGA
jgi:hypothetical protein